VALVASQSFDEFEARIRLTEAQRDRVKNRSAATRTFLEKSFPDTYDLALCSSSLMGSAARSTIIRPLTDLNVLAVFRNKSQVFEKYRRDSQAFLYRLRERIDARTQVTRVGARGQAVRLFYKDGLHVDIAPVFAWSGGGYGLPSGDGGWLTTDPPAQERWATDREAKLNNQYKRRVRLLKRWNDVYGNRLKSWHLEVIVGDVFTSMSSNHRNGLMRFFELAPRSISVQGPRWIRW
jgi:hypothetical protein